MIHVFAFFAFQPLFDTIDRNMLITRLSSWFRLDFTALS